MGIREKLNDNPAITNGITIGVIAIAGIFILYQLFFSGPSFDVPDQEYYTTDDGATFFADDIGKVVPFDHEGKPAVRAIVFQCEGEEPFVGYLEKYDDQTVKQLNELEQKLAAVDEASEEAYVLQQQRSDLMQMATLIKKPNTDRWVNAYDDPEGVQQVEPCEDGNLPRRVFP